MSSQTSRSTAFNGSNLARANLMGSATTLTPTNASCPVALTRRPTAHQTTSDYFVCYLMNTNLLLTTLSVMHTQLTFVTVRPILILRPFRFLMLTSVAIPVRLAAMNLNLILSMLMLYPSCLYPLKTHACSSVSTARTSHAHLMHLGLSLQCLYRHRLRQLS